MVENIKYFAVYPNMLILAYIVSYNEIELSYKTSYGFSINFNATKIRDYSHKDVTELPRVRRRRVARVATAKAREVGGS